MGVKISCQQLRRCKSQLQHIYQDFHNYRYPDCRILTPGRKNQQNYKESSLSLAAMSTTRWLSENSKIAVFAKSICILINKLKIMISEISSSRTVTWSHCLRAVPCFGTPLQIDYTVSIKGKLRTQCEYQVGFQLRAIELLIHRHARFCCQSQAFQCLRHKIDSKKRVDARAAPQVRILGRHGRHRQ